MPKSETFNSVWAFSNCVVSSLIWFGEITQPLAKTKASLRNTKYITSSQILPYFWGNIWTLCNCVGGYRPVNGLLQTFQVFYLNQDTVYIVENIWLKLMYSYWHWISNAVIFSELIWHQIKYVCYVVQDISHKWDQYQFNGKIYKLVFYAKMHKMNTNVL